MWRLEVVVGQTQGQKLGQVDGYFRHGSNLTTLEIFTHALAVSQLLAIDKGCPNAARLCLGFCELNGEATFDGGLFRNMENIKVTVGGSCSEEGKAHGPSVSTALQTLLKNKPLLERFTFLTGGNEVLTDDLVFELVTQGSMPNLREVTIASRSESSNKEPGLFALTDAALVHLMTFPKICRIGNLGHWSIKRSTVLAHRMELKATNVDLELLRHFDDEYEEEDEEDSDSDLNE